jgi:hypothetical protein
MKTLLLALALLVTGSAWADWVLVTTTDVNRIYIDPTTIRKMGGLRRVWELQDWELSKDSGHNSLRSRVEFDCEEKRRRPIVHNLHNGLWGTGRIIMTEDYDAKGTSSWSYIEPGTIGQAILDAVCAN